MKVAPSHRARPIKVCELTLHMVEQDMHLMKQYPASQKMTGIVTKNLDALQYGHATCIDLGLTKEISTEGTCSPSSSSSLGEMVVVVGKRGAPLLDTREHARLSLVNRP